MIASSCWLLGGWFLCRTARDLAPGRAGAFASLAFYLLLPFGITVSESFQPEALLVLAFLTGVWVLRRPGLETWRGTLTAGAVCGLAALVKPGFALFPLLGAYLALSVSSRGVRRVLISPQAYLFGALVLLPATIYALLFLRHHVEQKMVPELLGSTAFYSGWWLNIRGVLLGWVAPLAALVGAVILLRRRDPLVVGLLGGYLAFCLCFTWHIMAVDYYQVILIPIAALCLAPLAQVIFASVASAVRSYAWAIPGFILALTACFLFALPAENIVGADAGPQAGG